ncbi:hypothetical protein G9A89_016140 [Geosiphon pyriformis]|nr:hypothetical protein G9A89_016140 [Geosiphon pyriformis]
MIGKSILKPQSPVLSSKLSIQLSTILTKLPTYDTTVYISTTNLLVFDAYHLSTTVPTHISATAPSNLSVPLNLNTATELTSKQNPKAKTNTTKLEIVNHRFRQQNSGTGYTQNPNFQNYLSLLVIPEDAQPNNPETNPQLMPISNILPATITENKSLDAIFLFELKELSTTSLFSEATLKEKPITAMYTNAKVDDHFIKLILNIDYIASAHIIIIDGTTKISIGKIDDFPFEINGIIISIKVLVIETTQYQTLVRNDWLSKTNVILDWTTQELQLSQNGQHTCVPATCGHFKLTNMPTLLIKFKEEEKKPT